jgi:AcrR family transcriptional regulator
MTASATRGDAPAGSRRDQIIDAAVEAFAEQGFRGASTREIARRAGTNQGLITYHFPSKDALWRAAADRIFGELEASLEQRLRGLRSQDPRERAREVIREYVRFAARHPELFRMMVDEGRNAEDRMQWLVDTHLRPRYEQFATRGVGRLAGIDDALMPHAYYAMAGAGSLIFAVAPECRRLTGLDAHQESAVETHAELVARLLVPSANPA